MKLARRIKEMRPGELVLLAGLVLLTVLRFDQVAAMANMLLRAVMPLIVGAIIAYIINLVVKPIERVLFRRSNKKWMAKARRPLAILLAMLAILLVLALVVWLVVPELYATIRELTTRLPVFYGWLRDLFIRNFGSIPELQQQLPPLSGDFGQQIGPWLSRFAGGILNIAGSVVETFFEFVVSLIFALFLLASRDMLSRQFSKVLNVYFPDQFRHGLCTVLDVADDAFSKFFIGQAIEAVILGVLCIIGMLVFGFPYAFMIGTVIGITALIPLIGAYIGGVVGFILIASENPTKALWFLVFLLVLQQLEGDIIFPRVVGSSVGLPGIWVFVAVVIGGSLFGIPGILFGVPIAATAYKLLQRDIRSKTALEASETALAKPDEAKPGDIRIK